MIRKLVVLLLGGTLCLLLLIVTSVLAYNEVPMLRAKVAAGELPPVEERLPKEPYVIEPLEEIGQYGGTLYGIALDETVWNDLQWGHTDSPALIDVHPLFTRPALIGLVKDYDLQKTSDDEACLTLYLRKGLKWSDGMPLTTEDILFYWEDFLGNETLAGTRERTLHGRPLLTTEKVDDYTIRFYGNFNELNRSLANTWVFHGDWGLWGDYAPKHYLRKWHIKYNPNANELAKKEGFENWAAALRYHMQTHPCRNDLNRPTASAWVLKEKTSSVKVWERNPYYYAVDPAGNQLPYADRVINPIVMDREVLLGKILTGEASFASEQLSFKDYPLLAENAKKGNYQVHLFPSTSATDAGLWFNFGVKDKVLRKIFQDARFRRAASLAIDREEINETLFLGKAVPSQAMIVSTASFYEDWWGKAYIEYDPNKANELLDEMRLDKKNARGYRLRPDGKVLHIEILIHYPETIPVYELIKDYWEKVGIRVTIKEVALALWDALGQQGDYDVTDGESDWSVEMMQWVQYCRYWTPYAGETPYRSIPWTKWWDTGGKEGEEPPEEVKEFKKWIDDWADSVPGTKEYEELGKKIFSFVADKVWVIGTVQAPVVQVASHNVGNFPDFETAPRLKPYRYVDQLFVKEK